MLYFIIGVVAALIVFYIVYKLFVSAVTHGDKKKIQNAANYLNNLQRDVHESARNTRKQ